jgi:hypothetical protein
MNAPILWIALILPLASYAGESKPKYGPRAAPRASSISKSNEYFRSKNPAPDFWALVGYYVPQYTGAACSAASVAMVLNAARVRFEKNADEKVILQPDLVEKIQAEHWKERVTTGHEGRFGTSLDQLAKVAESAFKAYGFPKVSVHTVHVKDASEKSREEVAKALAENERSTKDFVIANFNQQAYTDDADAGHIAPVGAYDSKNKRVLVLDPDREYYEPYWVSLADFVAGMATGDKESGHNRGFLVIKTGS